MWRKLFHNIVAPLLFVVVSISLALFAIDILKYSKDNNITIIEPIRTEPEWIISPFDSMFKEVGELCDVDWVLLSAIASVESKFTPDAVSKVGATGLMQVMPNVAKNLGYNPELLLDARVCTEVAAILLHENKDMLRLSQSIEPDERLKFILACYNAGYSRIADARRLARYHEENANEWSVVAEYLPLLAKEEFANHEVVKSGVFNGSAETIAYVRKVMRVYKRHRDRVAKFESRKCQSLI